MRYSRIAGICTASFLWFGASFISATASAGQDDPRLSPLFDELQSAQNQAEIGAVVDQIWQIWHEYDGNSGAVGDLLEQGIFQMRVQDLDAAERSFSTAISEDENFAESWNKRATIRFLVGDFQGSVHDIQRTLILEPRHFGALSGLGLIYTRLEEWDLALKAYKSVLEIIPADPRALQWVEAIEKRLADDAI